MRQNLLLRIPLSRSERDAVLRNESNFVKGLTKANARRLTRFHQPVNGVNYDLKIILEKGGKAYLEVWPHGQDFSIWLPLNAAQKIDRVAGSLGDPSSWVAETLLLQATESPAALEACRLARGGKARPTNSPMIKKRRTRTSHR